MAKAISLLIYTYLLTKSIFGIISGSGNEEDVL
jgi:hypothetical protein